MKLYADISKTEELDDGTIKVWGYASSTSVDSDGETVTAEAMKAALPDYMRFGAVREMHQSKAAGTAIEARVEDDGRTYFGAHIVDSEAVKKVRANVYKGFSIGGKVTQRDELNKSVINGLKLVEISLVDRPANPEAVFTCYKSESAEPDLSAVDLLANMLNNREVSAETLLSLAKAYGHISSFDEIKKYDGREIYTSAQAIGALQCIASLFAYEKFNDTDIDQIEALRSAINSIKNFIASEIMEDEEREGEKMDEKELHDGLAEYASEGERAILAEAIAILEGSDDDDDAEPSEKMEKGDFPGHPFRGNQHTGGISSGATHASQRARGNETKTNHSRAAAAHRKAARQTAKEGHTRSAQYHQTMAAFHASRAGSMSKKDEEASDLEKTEGSDFLKKLSSDIEKLSQENNLLSKRVKELESMPAAGKATLKVIAKHEDAGLSISGSDQETKEKVFKADGAVDEVASLIKSIHKQGGALAL